MPAFVINGNSTVCKVYFGLSDYNSIENIANAQVLVTNQYNNLTVLDITKYPSEIMLKEIQSDANGYYIEINNTDINGGFVNDTNYKVQIRFGDKDTSTPDGSSWESWSTLSSCIFSGLSAVFRLSRSDRRQRRCTMR